jgi:hypothetical protein
MARILLSSSSGRATGCTGWCGVPQPRRSSGSRTSATTLHTGDLLDQRSLVDVLRDCEPDEIYNLATMSFVAASWSQPTLTAEFTAVGVTRMLEPMREIVPRARLSPGVVVRDVRQGPGDAAA